MIAGLFFVSCFGSTNNLPEKKNLQDDDTELVTQGKEIATKNGCLACHSIDGTKLVGPTLKGLYGSEATVTTDGKKRTVMVDDDYLKTSIYDPNHDIPDGYQANVMVSYKSLINDKDLTALIAYIKSLK